VKLEGAAAVLAGFLLYGLAAGIEAFAGTGPLVAATVEELGKASLLLGFCWQGWKGGPERNPRREARGRLLRLARRLSLGLVAVAVFVGVENLAYLAAFPEAGVLARLLWSLPVHLVAALVEALGFLLVFRRLAGGRRPGLAGAALGSGGLVLAWAWHLGANLLVSGRLTPKVFTAGVVIANLLFLVLMMQFLRKAYLGGFLHGAD